MTVYVGEVPGQPALLADDANLRVAPYAVIYASAGDPNPHGNLEATLEGGGDFLWSAQITFAAGYLNDLLAVLDEAVPQLHLWRPVVAGIECGPLRPPLGYNPGPVRRDNDARPTRFWTPTLWQLHYAGA